MRPSRLRTSPRSYLGRTGHFGAVCRLRFHSGVALCGSPKHFRTCSQTTVWEERGSRDTCDLCRTHKLQHGSGLKRHCPPVPCVVSRWTRLLQHLSRHFRTLRLVAAPSLLLTFSIPAARRSVWSLRHITIRGTHSVTLFKSHLQPAKHVVPPSRRSFAFPSSRVFLSLSL